MMTSLLMLLIGCAEQSDKGTPQVRSKLMADYAGLTEDAAWTYRNQGWNYEDPDLLLDSTLVPARHLGDGVVQLRRGLNWTDSTDYGVLYFDTTDGGLTLIKWSLPGNTGEGWYPFAGEEIIQEEPIEGDWTCTATEPTDGAETFYAAYESVFVFTCTGGGLEGEWVFANGLGLVQYMSFEGDMGLELVAPW
jgi:hypothetical protein